MGWRVDSLLRPRGVPGGKQLLASGLAHAYQCFLTAFWLSYLAQGQRLNHYYLEPDSIRPS